MVFKSTPKTVGPKTVSITAEEYRKLLQDSAELSRLRAALQPAPRDTKRELAGNPDLGNDGYLDGDKPFALASLASALEETSTVATSEPEDGAQNVSPSVVLLPPIPVTHGQVAAAVRGGPLIQIYLQRNSNQVNVTFAHPEAAAALITYAESTSFYVAGHKTIVQAASRAYVAPQYVYQQVQDGLVSRNLVIKKVDESVTEASLRRDLKHIHNLAIISITFENDNAYISTSSTGGALFARTCLKSRFAYKEFRMDFYEDECAKPLPKIRRRSSAVAVPKTPVPKTTVPKAPKKNPSSDYNPFELLSQDEFELADYEIQDEFEDHDN